MTRRGVAVIVVVGAGLALWSPDASTRSVLVAGADRIADQRARGAVVFYGDDFGGLSATSLQTHALPWKLGAAALMYAAKKQNPNLPLTRAELARQFQAFGFLSPGRIGNWPSGVGRILPEARVVEIDPQWEQPQRMAAEVLAFVAKDG